MKRTPIPAVVAAFLLVLGAVGASGAVRPSIQITGTGPDAIREGVSATAGVGIILPVVGRLTANGTLFITAVDATNFAATSVKVDLIFQGNDIKTGAPIVITGTLSTDGAGKMRSFSDAHFEDFLGLLGSVGVISQDQLNDGILGSLQLIFEGVTTSGLANARARFLSARFGGTIGVSLVAHEFNGTETTAVAGNFSDTRGLNNAVNLYSNIFLTNIGEFEFGSGLHPSTDNVTISAFANDTGQPIGTPLKITLATGQTISTSLGALGVPPGAGQVIVLARATSGSGLLLGVGAAIDSTTSDPSGFEMANVPANSTGPAPSGGGGGDLASALNGTWDGTWNNATFSTLGSTHAVISVNTTAHTFSATLTLGGNVFGGSAPAPVSFTGTYSTSTGVSFSGHDALFGDITFTITPAGAISGSATNVPSSNVSSVSFTGTATSTSITVNYTIQLKPSGTATGTLTMTKTH